MKIQKDLTEWFEIPDDEDGARFNIKYIQPGKLRAIRSKAFNATYHQTVGKKNMESRVKIDNDLITEKMFMEAVIGWENVNNADGEEIHCSTKHKKLIYDSVVGIDAFVMNRLDELGKKYKSKVEIEEKN